jgi:hypothetical protein
VIAHLLELLYQFLPQLRASLYIFVCNKMNPFSYHDENVESYIRYALFLDNISDHCYVSDTTAETKKHYPTR